MSTGQAVQFLLSKGLKIWQVARSLNIERSTVYYHSKDKKIKSAASLRDAFKRLSQKVPELKNLSFDDFLPMIQAGGKYICFYSGKEIDPLKDAWALNARDSGPYIYLKKYNALEKLHKEMEKISARFLLNLDYQVIKSKA
jgi:hypothetical protein